MLQLNIIHQLEMGQSIIRFNNHLHRYIISPTRDALSRGHSTKLEIILNFLQARFLVKLILCIQERKEMRKGNTSPLQIRSEEKQQQKNHKEKQFLLEKNLNQQLLNRICNSQNFFSVKIEHQVSNYFLRLAPELC